MNWTKWIWPGMVVVALLGALILWFEGGRMGPAASQPDSAAMQEPVDD